MTHQEWNGKKLHVLNILTCKLVVLQVLNQSEAIKTSEGKKKQGDINQPTAAYVNNITLQRSLPTQYITLMLHHATNINKATII